MPGLVSISVFIVLIGISARWNWWRWPRRGVAILMYHKIGDPPAGSKLKKLWISPEKFERHLRYLKNKNIPVITCNEYYAMLREGTVPYKAAIITFDDGYENNYIHAFPLLKKYGFKGSFFIVTDTIGKMNVWHKQDTESRQKMLSGEQIAEMAAAGMEIGSHTVHHPHLKTRNAEQARKEITESKHVLERLIGKPVEIFAYPYGAGAYSKAVKELVGPAGYKLALGIRQGVNVSGEEDYFALKRITVRRDENMFDFYLQIRSGKNRF